MCRSSGSSGRASSARLSCGSTIIAVASRLTRARASSISPRGKTIPWRAPSASSSSRRRATEKSAARPPNHSSTVSASAARKPAGSAPASFRAALDTWGGEPLAEDAYLEWAQEDRRHLSLAFLEALEGAATAALVTGNPAAAGAWAGPGQAREPLRETSAMLVVRALAASGDQAGALAAFDSFRRRLAGDAGLDPSPDAREIRQRVLLGRPLPAGPGRRPASRPAQPLELDDLQWADPASLILLGLILRRAGRVSMVAAYRPDGPAASFAAAETLGMPGEQVGHITLRPQPADAIRALAGDPLPAEVILEQAGCTPLAVTEAVATATGHAAVHRDLDGRRPLRSPGNIAEARAAATAGLRHAVA